MKTRNLILAISSIVLLTVSCSFGNIQARENYYFKTFTVENGLSHNTIKSITQDKTGFLWIASWDGLSRYDGNEFKNYYHYPDDSTSLPYFSIQKVVADRFNNLWVLPVAAEMPPVIYDRSNDTFINICKNQAIRGLLDITADLNGNVWLAGANGLERFDYKENIFRHLDMLDENMHKLTIENTRPFFLFDNKGNIWIFVENQGVWQIFKSILIDESHVIFTRFNSMAVNSIPQRRIFSGFDSFKVFETVDGNRWLFSNYGLLGKNTKNKVFKEYGSEISNLEFTGASSFAWCVNTSIINFYDSFSRTNNSITLSSDQQISCSYFDNGNTMWYSIQVFGEGTGLTRLIRTPPFFRHYFLGQNQNKALNAYFAVLKTKNMDIWAAPRNLNFLYRIKPDGQILKCNKLDPGTWQKVVRPCAFLEDSTGIWIGYYSDNMLMHFDYKNKKFSKKVFRQTDKTTLGIPNTLKGFETDGEDIIINGDRAVYRYTLKNNEIRPIWGEKNTSVIYCITKDRENNFWLGLERSTIKCFDHNFNEKASYRLTKSISNVEDICIGDNNDIWAALLGSGVAHLDLKTGKAEILTTANGLSNNTTYNILKDKSGNLWISTNHGISRYNPKTRQFRIFGQSDGLKIDEFNSGAAFQSPDGEMLFGGMGGVVGFYPDSLRESANSYGLQPLIITDFKVSGIPRLFQKAVYDMDTVSLKKGEDNFQLSFACIDFKNADKIKYRYQLFGEDVTFTQTDHQHRFINYANLKPGDYRLEIEATNSIGEWSSKKSLVILIPPLLYQVIWFKLGIILVLLIVISAFVLMYYRQIRMKASREQAELRLESLRGQMNPHFIFNSLNSINYFISQNDRLSANRYIADFSRLIRSFLGNLSKEYVPFENELELLKDYLRLEHLRFSDKFDYTIEIPEGFDNDSRMVFPGMVQPFIENAIWHGVRGPVNRKSIVTVKFMQGGDEYCKCIIEDDGIGRKLSEARKSDMPGRKSNGIRIVTERLRIFNQVRQSNLRIMIEDLYPDRVETGTRVTIEIPSQYKSETKRN